jgi:hypothetical protein
MEYRRVVRRAAELLCGEDIPADEPLAVIRARARLVYRVPRCQRQR